MSSSINIDRLIAIDSFNITSVTDVFSFDRLIAIVSVTLID